MNNNYNLEELTKRLIEGDKLNGSELLFYLKEKLNDFGTTWMSSFAYFDYDPEEIHLGEVREVDSWGGEGEGDHIGYVYYFKNHDIYLRIDGFYTSHDGAYWDYEPYVVSPQEKTVTVYE